jgi:hypothetical protein
MTKRFRCVNHDPKNSGVQDLIYFVLDFDQHIETKMSDTEGVKEKDDLAEEGCYIVEICDGNITEKDIEKTEVFKLKFLTNPNGAFISETYFY